MRRSRRNRCGEKLIGWNFRILENISKLKPIKPKNQRNAEIIWLGFSFKTNWVFLFLFLVLIG